MRLTQAARCSPCSFLAALLCCGGKHVSATFCRRATATLLTSLCEISCSNRGCQTCMQLSVRTSHSCRCFFTTASRHGASAPKPYPVCPETKWLKKSQCSAVHTSAKQKLSGFCTASAGSPVAKSRCAGLPSCSLQKSCVLCITLSRGMTRESRYVRSCSFVPQSAGPDDARPCGRPDGAAHAQSGCRCRTSIVHAVARYSAPVATSICRPPSNLLTLAFIC